MRRHGGRLHKSNTGEFDTRRLFASAKRATNHVDNPATKGDPDADGSGNTHDGKSEWQEIDSVLNQSGYSAFNFGSINRNFGLRLTPFCKTQQT